MVAHKKDESANVLMTHYLILGSSDEFLFTVSDTQWLKYI